MSWLAITSLLVLIGSLHTLLRGPLPEWGDKKIVFELVCAIAGAMIGVYGLRNY